MIASHERNQLLDPSGFEQEILKFLNTFQFSGQKPSLDHIRSVAQYYSRLPYENISKILKRADHPVGQLFRLPDELLEDHYAWHAGGTCFSLTYLLMGIYRILGYDTDAIICDLNWGANNHSAVMIQFGGQRYLVDPGYMIFKPLALVQDNVQTRISAETGISLRYDQEDDLYSLYTFRKQQFTRRYSFHPKAVPLDQFSKFWKDSFELPGMDDLILTRVEDYEMTFIQGDFIKITAPEQTQKFREADLAEKLIRDQFQIPLEKVEAARYLLKN